jgi:hypothetical protein
VHSCCAKSFCDSESMRLGFGLVLGDLVRKIFHRQSGDFVGFSFAQQRTSVDVKGGPKVFCQQLFR